MTVFPFPPDFPGLSMPFSVVGFDWDNGAPDGELLVLPRGCGVPAFGGPVFTPDAAFDDDRLLRPADAAPEHGPVWMDAFCPRGTLRSRLTAAVAAFGSRLWLHLAPMSTLYTLPCPDGAGTPVPEAERAALLRAHPSCFCPEFVCQCAHWPDGGTVRVLLYGTDETLAMQLALAAACGVPQVFGPLTAARSGAVFTD